MAEPEDLATNIAQNIGYMPMVNKAGEMGSGFLDFLGGLLPGSKGKPAAPAAAQAQAQPAGDSDFLSSLWKSITSGAQNTADAFRDDYGNIQEGQLPKHLMKDAGGILGLMGGPNMGNVQIPAYKMTKWIPGPGGLNVPIEGAGKTVPGGDWLSIFTRQGGLGGLLEQLLKQYEKNKFQ